MNKKFYLSLNVNSSDPATAFLARTSGLDATHTNAYTALINGLVSDGVWSLLDALWIPATQDSTTAGLNLVSPSFTLTITNGGTPLTFTADRGYKATATSSHIDTNFNLLTNGVAFTQNSAHISAWSVNSSTSTTIRSIIAAGVAGSPNTIHPKYTDNNAYGRCNDATGLAGVANSNRQGFWLANRSSSVQRDFYKNGSSIESSGSNTSTAPASANLLGLYDTVDVDNLDTLGVISIGGDVSSVQNAFYTRLRTYMTAVGAP